MAYESQAPPLQSDYYGHDWPMDKVIRWLDANDFKAVIEVFRGIISLTLTVSTLANSTLLSNSKPYLWQGVFRP